MIPALFPGPPALQRSPVTGLETVREGGVGEERGVDLSREREGEVSSSVEGGRREEQVKEEEEKDPEEDGDSPGPATPLDCSPRPRPLDCGTGVAGGQDSQAESAAKLLFMSVKWARSIPSFQQLARQDQV